MSLRGGKRDILSLSGIPNASRDAAILRCSVEPWLRGTLLVELGASRFADCELYARALRNRPANGQNI